MSISPRDTCNSDTSYNGEYLAYRISSIFVVFAASAIGSFFPLLAKYNTLFKFPSPCFFFLKYVGSGVIVATGFIHLLAEADESLGDPCLGGVWEEYPWSDGICLMGVFSMFFLDIIAHKKLHQNLKKLQFETTPLVSDQTKDFYTQDTIEASSSELYQSNSQPQGIATSESLESIYQRILNCLVLEFGIVFHSVFVGLSLAIAGDEFIALYIAITFHQLLEGLGLGTRFASTTWPKGKLWVPWTLSLCYSFTTPIAIAIGLAVRTTYLPGSRTALVTTGVFDAFCGGILIYNSLVELMAYDFLFSSEFENDPTMFRMLLAFLYLMIGAASMAILAKWA